jgi:hypothetical protein
MRSISLSILVVLLWAGIAQADVAWFIAPYVRITIGNLPGVHRGCAVRQFHDQIKADGGKWRAAEVLGNKCLVKVSASAATLQTIAASYTRIPASRLDDPLSTLTNAQRTAIRQVILDAGYTVAEVNARFPNLANNTLGDALRFLASRRLTPRYDQSTDTIILDGAVQSTINIDTLDGVVR